METNNQMEIDNIEITEWGTYIHDYGRLVVQCSSGSYVGCSVTKGHSWVYWDDPNEPPFVVGKKSMLRSAMVSTKRLYACTVKMSPGDTFYVYWEDEVCAKVRISTQGSSMDWARFLLAFLPAVKKQVDCLVNSHK